MFFKKSKKRIAELELLVDSLINEVDSLHNRLINLEGVSYGENLESEPLDASKVYGEEERLAEKARLENL